MDKLHESILLQILSRLDDSSDVARCRVAWKAFDALFPGLRSINLCDGSINSRFTDSTSIKKIFLDLILRLETVESVSVDIFGEYDFILTDFAEDWMPRVAGSLKSLSMHGSIKFNWGLKSNILLLISEYCHNLVTLKLSYACDLCMHNLNPMPMLTSFTLHRTHHLDDEDLNELNTCFPNLQVLSLNVSGFKDPKIHHLNLQVCHLDLFDCCPSSLTLITPNLVTLKIECRFSVASIHVEAPMLSNFHLDNIVTGQASVLFAVTKFKNLKTLLLDSFYICPLLSKFPITKTLETLALYSQTAHDSKLTLAKVFMLFPNVKSLRFNPCAFSILEDCMNLDGYEMLDQFSGLSGLSLLIHSDVSVTRLERFMSKCKARRPWLKWRWGRWKKHLEDSWIADGIPS